MRGARCLQAATDLLRSHAVFTPFSESSLLQRLHSSLFCSTSSTSASSFSSLAHSSSAVLNAAADNIQQHSHLPSFAVRGYARMTRPDRRQDGRSGDARNRRRDSQREAAPQRDQSFLRLGRRTAYCKATEDMRKPFYPNEYDPFQDKSPENIKPRLPDGKNEMFSEQALMLRHQLEQSALPNEFKRAQQQDCWDEVLMDLNRTVKVTKGGKVETLHAVVAVGNYDGVIGIGEHSGKNVQKVILDAQLKAYKNLVPIPRYREHTIFHPIDQTNRKVRIKAWPRQSGFGVIASPFMRILCDLAGLHDITVKCMGSRRNKKALVYTFVDAVSSQSVPHDGVEGSGIYMREVYWKKSLPCGLRRGVDVP